MDWKKIYEERKCTAKEAVQKIKSGDRVVLAHAVAEPKVLAEAMVENKEAYKNVTVSHMVTLGKGEYSLPENSEHFTFEGVCQRRRNRWGRIVPYSSIRFPYKKIFLDVMMVTVSKPDEHGYCIGYLRLLYQGEVRLFWLR